MDDVVNEFRAYRLYCATQQQLYQDKIARLQQQISTLENERDKALEAAHEQFLRFLQMHLANDSAEDTDAIT